MDSPAARRRAHACSSLALALVLGVLAGCTARVVPPSAPESPVTVWVRDYGSHCTLTLPHADGNLWEYSYGEWKFFAEGDQSGSTALRAILGTGDAALARQPSPVDGLTLERGVRYPGLGTVLPLQVPAARVAELRDRLGAVFADPPGGERMTRGRTEYVRLAERYSWARQCNHRVCEWLESLGCRVRAPGCATSIRRADDR